MCGGRSKILLSFPHSKVRISFFLPDGLLLFVVDGLSWRIAVSLGTINVRVDVRREHGHKTVIEGGEVEIKQCQTEEGVLEGRGFVWCLSRNVY